MPGNPVFESPPPAPSVSPPPGPVPPFEESSPPESPPPVGPGSVLGPPVEGSRRRSTGVGLGAAVVAGRGAAAVGVAGGFGAGAVLVGVARSVGGLAAAALVAVARFVRGVAARGRGDVGAVLELEVEVGGRFALEGVAGVLAPDLGGGAAAVDTGEAHGAVQGLVGGGLRVLAHDGDDGGQVGGVAGEPGGGVLLGGAGLGRGGATGGLGGGGGAVLDDAAQDGRGGVGGLAADGLVLAPLGQLDLLLAVLHDLLDQRVGAVPAVVGEGRVGLGHVEGAGGGDAEGDGGGGQLGGVGESPRSIAVCLTLSEPTSTAIWAYTALMDLSVASRTVTWP